MFSLLCVWLSIKRNVLNWPAGIIGVIAYLILFYQIQLYADMILQVFFVGQGIYGWYHWQKEKISIGAIEVLFMTTTQRIFIIILLILITFGWGFLLTQYTDGSVPYIDAFAATSSFTANALMARKKIENWILWIVADVVYIGLFWYKELYLSCGIYLIFLVMAITGLITWIKNANTNTVSR